MDGCVRDRNREINRAREGQRDGDSDRERKRGNKLVCSIQPNLV